jgi:hypothetical protein
MKAELAQAGVPSRVRTAMKAAIARVMVVFMTVSSLSFS